ncbi:MAG: EamA family transporter [Candidatus Bathyarchaeia archaeon]
MENLLYVLLAVFFWGLAPVFGKLGLIEVSPLLGLSVRSFGISLILIVVGVLSGELVNLADMSLNSAALILAEGVFAGLLGHFSYYCALKIEEASRVVVLTRAAPVLTVAISVLFLGESISYQKIGGMALIIAGAILINL